jgi:hypothetical protein
MFAYPGTIKAVKQDETPSSSVALLMASLLPKKDEPHPTKPIGHLPARLDADACLKLLAQADGNLTVEGIKAGRQSVTLEMVDGVLEHSSLGIDDRMRLKHALASHGIIVAGKKV